MRVVLLVLTLAGVLAAASEAVGTWSCAAMSPDGEAVKFVLKVQEQSGRVSATVEDARGATPVIDPKLDGSILTFQVNYDGARYKLELKFSGDQVKGAYRGEQASGEVKGSRTP